MKKLYRTLLWGTLPILDFAVITCSGMLSYGIYRIMEIGEKAVYPLGDVFYLCILTGLGSVLILILLGTYEKESGILNVEEVKYTIKGMTLSFFCFAMIMVLMRYQIPRYVLVFSYLLSILLLVVEKTICYRVLSISSWTDMTRKILIYGAGELGQDLFRAISNSPKHGVRPVGFVDDAPGITGASFRSSSFHNSSQTITVLGTGKEISHLVQTLDIDEVWVAISNVNNNSLIAILSRLKAENIKVSFVPNLYKVLYHDMTIETIGRIPLVSEDNPLRANPYLAIKKLVDMMGAALLLVVFSPLFFWIFMAVKKDSSGPVFFCHQRIGINGTPFNLVKFRTMKTRTDPYAVNPMNMDDPRITRIGRILRRTSLDELPQLLNVLKGEMSLVGPRPEMPFIVDTYTERHRQRLRVKPGITGLWQLSGDRANPIHHNMDYDQYYIRHQSFFLDIAILIETALFAFRGI